jgi:hypothetical protein
LLKIEIARAEENTPDADAKLSVLLGNLKRVRESGTAWKPYKKSGRAALDQANQGVFDELCAICAVRGLFIVPVGELESWMTQFGLSHTSNKPKWIVAALEMLPKIEPDFAAGPWMFLRTVFDYLGRTPGF